MKYQSDQPAAVADSALNAAVREMDSARHCAVLWFAEIQRRRLFRDLGFGNMAAYATTELKFSKTRTNDFLRLAQKLDQLPAVRESMASGALGYTKAMEIVKVASPRTEKAWVAEAVQSGRRALVQKVQRVKVKAAQRRTGQPTLIPDSRTEAKLAAEVPVRVTLDMTPEQFARYETLMEKVGAMGPNRVEALLAGLETLATGTLDDTKESDTTGSSEPTRRRVATSNFQIYIRKCPECDNSTVPTSRGEKFLGRADSERIACDARVRETGRPNRATIPPSRRSEVLERDRFTCQAPGCAHTRFLEVHHRIPRSRGGNNEVTNLITLCAGCHRLHHERGIEPVMTA